MSAVQLAVEEHPSIIGRGQTPVISRATCRSAAACARRGADDEADGGSRTTARTLQSDGEDTSDVADGATRTTGRATRRGYWAHGGQQRVTMGTQSAIHDHTCKEKIISLF